MKNENQWIPTKFQLKNGNWIPDGRFVGLGSRYITNLTIPFYQTAIEQNCSGNFLDCGCGNVPYYGIYKNLVDNITCIDWAESFHNNPYLDYLVDLNNDKIPSQSDTFDSILLADVLEHLYDPQHAINEISRVLKPNGNVIIVVPFMYWLHEEPHDYFRFTEHALKKMCSNAGLKITKLEQTGGLPDVIIDLFEKAFIKSNKRLKWFSSIVFRLNKTKWFLKLRARTKNQFPLSYVVVASK